jgi:hypothetical protein
MEAYLARGRSASEAKVQAFLQDLALDRLVGLAAARELFASGEPVRAAGAGRWYRLRIRPEFAPRADPVAAST